MAQQTINVGSSANDGTGDPARTAGQKINSNFTELYADVAQLQAGNGLSGPLTILAGGAAAPSLRLSGDTDTGLFSGGAGVLGIAVDGAERARFTTTGLVLANPLAIASGGTGATTAAAARSNLGVAIGSNVQAWDADLDAIAGLTGPAGLLRKTAANTWALETAVYLTGNETITFTGDATGSGATAVALTLANSGVAAGSYANASVTVDAKGRVTAATANPNPVTSFSGGTTGLTPSVGTNGTVVLGGTLGVANGGTGVTTLTGFVKGNGSGAMTAQAKIALSDLDTVGNANSSSYLRGDGTWAGIPTQQGGTVSSVQLSGGTTGLTASGGPITSTGTITLAGTLAVTHGGTGATNAAGARANLEAAAAIHTHAVSDVTGLSGQLAGLQTAIDGKAATSHTHPISDVTGLQAALDGKAATSHTHTIANVTGLQGALDGKLNTSGGTVTGSVTIQNGDLQVGSSNNTASYIRMMDDESTNGRKSIHANSNLIGFLGGNDSWLMYVNTNAHIWTPGYGWLHDFFFNAVSNCSNCGSHGLSGWGLTNCNPVGSTNCFVTGGQLNDGGGTISRSDYFTQFRVNCNCNCNC